MLCYKSYKITHWCQNFSLKPGLSILVSKNVHKILIKITTIVTIITMLIMTIVEYSELLMTCHKFAVMECQQSYGSFRWQREREEVSCVC